MRIRELAVTSLAAEEQSGKILVFNVHPEDLGKKKEERIPGEGEYEPITPDMKAFVHGKIKPEDWRAGRGINDTVNQTLLREVESELGIVLHRQQIGHPKEELGHIDQRRNGKEYDFLVYLVFQFLLSEQQVAELEKKMGTIVKLDPSQVGGYVAENEKQFRPAARLAARAFDLRSKQMVAVPTAVKV